MNLVKYEKTELYHDKFQHHRYAAIFINVESVLDGGLI